MNSAPSSALSTSFPVLMAVPPTIGPPGQPRWPRWRGPAQHAQLAVHLADQAGHGRLAGAGIAGEDQVMRARLDVLGPPLPGQLGVGHDLEAQRLKVLLDAVEAPHLLQPGRDAAGLGRRRGD